MAYIIDILHKTVYRLALISIKTNGDKNSIILGISLL